MLCDKGARQRPEPVTAEPSCREPRRASRAQAALAATMKQSALEPHRTELAPWALGLTRCVWGPPRGRGRNPPPPPPIQTCLQFGLSPAAGGALGRSCAWTSCAFLWCGHPDGRSCWVGGACAFTPMGTASSHTPAPLTATGLCPPFPSGAAGAAHGGICASLTAGMLSFFKGLPVYPQHLLW